jgi:hypothetical protein
MSGPPAGVQLSPAQIAAFKEAGVRNTFIIDLSAGFGPFIMGYVLPLYSFFSLQSSKNEWSWRIDTASIWCYSVSWLLKYGIGIHG